VEVEAGIFSGCDANGLSGEVKMFRGGEAC
jgi:hypothetical protein